MPDRDRDDALREAFDPEAFRARGHALIDQLADHLAASLARPDAPVLPWAEPAEQRARWPATFPAPGGGGDLAGRALAASIRLHHPRYVGHQTAPALPAGALADLVSAFLNNGMAVYEMGPAATAAEQNVLAWLAGALGFGPGAGGALTSGGSLGNLTALLAARQARAGFDVWDGGALAGPPLALLASDQAHYCVDRAARILGWGAGGVVRVPCDERFRLRADGLEPALARARAAGRRPVALVACAGSTATGAYDPLEPAAEFCARHGLWLHVDGAHGAAAALSPKYRHLLAGVERADSVVWDAHKMLLLPALVTAVIYRDGARAPEAFRQSASYLFGAGGGASGDDDLAQRTLECTKRMLGYQLYAALAAHGPAPFAAFVERSYDLARAFARAVREAPDFELAVEPEANIVCFRLRPRGLEPGGPLDDVQARARDRVVRDGAFYLVRTRLPAGLFLRVALMNPFTTEADLDDLLSALRRAAG
jgi:L-2,4-diaminobutyrate decarboxylase